MSSINTAKLNVSYPVPGTNNNSQGFRDNFSAIKTNLDAAGTEITDLQQKAIVKTALTGIPVDNNMQDTLISNALTRSFRSTTYNLGSALSGKVVIDVSKGDVQYGAIVGNVSLEFTGWASAGMQSKVDLQLSITDSTAAVSFPPQININDCLGASTLESYKDVLGIVTVTVPLGVCQLNYTLTSLDAGETISIEQSNRPRKSTELRVRTPVATGRPGDVTGTISTDPAVTSLVVTATTTATNKLTTSSTASLYLDQPVSFTGYLMGGLTTATYYIRSIDSATEFTVSASPGTVSGPGAVTTLSSGTGSMILTPTTFVYVAAASYNSVASSSVATATDTSGNITLTSVAGVALNDPIVFSGIGFGNVQPDVIYYVAAIASNNVKVSRTRNAGLAGQVVVTTTATGSLTSTCYSGGQSIWRRIPLQAW